MLSNSRRTLVVLACLATVSICAQSKSADKRLTVPTDPNGDTDVLSNMAFSSDGRFLVAGYGVFRGFLQDPDPGQVVVWDTTTQKKVMAFADHKDGISGVAFTPDGKSVISSSYGGSAKSRTMPMGKPGTSFSPLSRPITCQAISPDGKWLLLGTTGAKDEMRSLWLFEISSGRKGGQLKGHTDDISAVVFSPNGKSIISSGLDSTIRIWDLSTRKQTHVIKTKSFAAVSLAFTPNGKKLVAGGIHMLTMPREGKGEVRIFESTKWTMTGSLPRFKSHVLSIVVSPDSKWLITGTGIGEVWNLNNTKQSMMIPGAVYMTALSPNGKTLAVSDHRGIRLIEFQSIIQSK